MSGPRLSCLGPLFRIRSWPHPVGWRVLIDGGGLGKRFAGRRRNSIGYGRGIFGMRIGDARRLTLEYSDACGKGRECRESGQQSPFHTSSPPMQACTPGMQA